MLKIDFIYDFCSYKQKFNFSKTTYDLFLFTLKYLDINVEIHNYELCMRFTDNINIKKLNNLYRDKNYPTDVLSFPTKIDNDFLTLPNGDVLLGDIVISIEKAEEQSKNINRSLKEEIIFLQLHGFLHLLGYEHNEEKKANKMFSLQKYLLKNFNE